MENHNGEVHVDETEASGGSKEGVVRWVLGIGLLLAVGLLSLIWITGALSQGDVEEEITVSGTEASMAEEGDGTDSIVTDGADDIEGAPDTVNTGDMEAEDDPATGADEMVETE